MKKWLNYLPTIFILSIVLSLVFYSSQGSTVQMNYTQFEKIVDEVDFKKSSMTISSTVIHLEGTYEQNSKTVGYKVIVPRTEKNIEKLEKSLQRNGGKLTVEDPNQGSVWISDSFSNYSILNYSGILLFHVRKNGWWRQQ